MRIAVAALVLIGLVAGVWLLWPDGGDEETPTTEAVASTTTTGSTPDEPATTTTVDPTSTTEPETHVVETVDEAEEILRELWFGWFEGIYNQDEERIREVVVLEETVETAEQSFGTEFARAPLPGDLAFSESEILRSDEECLAVWSVMETIGFRHGSSEGVHVIRWDGSRWLRLSLWQFREDLWDADCDSALPLP